METRRNMNGEIKLGVTILSITTVVVALVLFSIATFFAPKTTVKEGFYLTFLKEQSESDWHLMWQQLWDLSDTVEVPKSMINVYGDETKAADKIIEQITSYGFWVDDNGTNGQYKYIVDSSKLIITDIKYFPEANQMKAEVEFILQKVLSQVFVKGKPLQTLANINQYLCYNTDYSAEGTMQGQTLYSVLIEKKALCGGFARTFNALAILSGIDSHISVGYLVTPTGNVRHAWNTYSIDGVDYVADSTSNRTSGNITKVINREVGAFYYASYIDTILYAEAVHLRSN